MGAESELVAEYSDLAQVYGSELAAEARERFAHLYR
jgi:hypothetical protein